MDPVNTAEEEVKSNLLAGNFSRAMQLSEQWLAGLAVAELGSESYRRAAEAFFYSRFFLHRQERLSQMPAGAERARLFMAFLRELELLRTEKELNLIDGLIWPSVRFYIHSQIAESLARAFAGQRAYDLNQDEMLQLAVSLIEIENWRPARETLSFMLQLNKKNALLRLYFSYVSFQLSEEEGFYSHLREALLIRPEVLSGHLQYLPPGVFQSLWTKLQEAGYPDELKFRYFALLAEVNGLFLYRRELMGHELNRFENDLQKMLLDYRQNIRLRPELEPRILQYLCWLLESFQKQKNQEKFSEYQSIMLELDRNLWETFRQKVLKEKAG